MGLLLIVCLLIESKNLILITKRKFIITKTFQSKVSFPLSVRPLKFDYHVSTVISRSKSALMILMLH